MLQNRTRISKINPELTNLTSLAKMPKKQISSDFSAKLTKVRNLKRCILRQISLYNFVEITRQNAVVNAFVARNHFNFTIFLVLNKGYFNFQALFTFTHSFANFIISTLC